MAKQDYIPNREDELLAWYANIAAKLPTYQAALGLLDIRQSGGFVPNVLDRFDVLTSGSLSGRFQQVDGEEVGNGLVFALDYANSGATLVATYPGDANFDGRVSGADYTRWADNFGRTNADWNQGDFNFDHQTNAADYDVWRSHYGFPGPLPSPVPEPAAWLLASIGIAAILAARMFGKRRCVA